MATDTVKDKKKATGTTSKAAASKASASKTSASKASESKASVSRSSASKATEAKPAARKKPAKETSDAKSHSTTDHDEIRNWVEQRGGKPATVKGTDAKKKAGILRIDFPGFSGDDALEEISWDEFFAKFDESNLEFLYQSETADGKESRFNKFVSGK